MCTRVPFPPQPCNTYYLLFDTSLSDRCEVVSHCGLICFFLIISDIEHLLIYLLAICTSFFEKCLFRFFIHFLIKLFGILLLSCSCFLYILDINPLSAIGFANISFHFIGCLFILDYFHCYAEVVASSHRCTKEKRNM